MDRVDDGGTLQYPFDTLVVLVCFSGDSLFPGAKNQQSKPCEFCSGLVGEGYVGSFLLLIIRPGTPSSFLLLVVWPGAHSSVLATSNKARSP